MAGIFRRQPPDDSGGLLPDQHVVVAGGFVSEQQGAGAGIVEAVVDEAARGVVSRTADSGQIRQQMGPVIRGEAAVDGIGDVGERGNDCCEEEGSGDVRRWVSAVVKKGNDAKSGWWHKM